MDASRKPSVMSPLWIVWLICGFTCGSESSLVTNAASKNYCNSRKTCGELEYDIHEAVCCENQLHQGEGLLCCGEWAFNPSNASCCEAQITPGLGQRASACCGPQAFNPLNEMCCQSTVMTKPAPKAKCCGKEAVDEDKQICCGVPPNQTSMMRISSHHLCCGTKSYDSLTRCCCDMKRALDIQLINSTCCVKKSEKDKQLKISSHHTFCGDKQYDNKTECCCSSGQRLLIHPIDSSCCENGVEPQKIAPQPKCTEPNTSVCGSLCYNPNESACCEKKQTKSSWCCSSGRCDEGPKVYSRSTKICCDGCLSTREPWMDQCCGQTPYGLTQVGVLCCNTTLYKHREDGEECSETGIPYNPSKGTVCCSHFHTKPGQHCCGAETYTPPSEICCNGHRQLKGANNHCCGIKAFNIKDRHMKCCGDTLYNLTSLGKPQHEALCCGSTLHGPQDVCCSSGSIALLYSKKTEFRCCGHRYFNTSLWSCHAGKLSPARQPGQLTESTFLSMNNLDKSKLCNEVKMGAVESVSVLTIVFNSVLKINGTTATVKALPSPYILTVHDHCNTPKVIPGQTYLFNQDCVLTVFNHGSSLQALHFIISKCHHA